MAVVSLCMMHSRTAVPSHIHYIVPCSTALRYCLLSARPHARPWLVRRAAPIRPLVPANKKPGTGTQRPAPRMPAPQYHSVLSPFSTTCRDQF